MYLSRYLTNNIPDLYLYNSLKNMSIKSIVLLFYFLNINGNQVNSISISSQSFNNQTQKFEK